MSLFRQVSHGPNCFVGTYENVVVAYWTDVASVNVVADLRAVFQRFKTSGRKILYLSYLEDKTLSRETPHEFREALAKLLSDYRDDIGAGLIVYEKSGLKGAMLRAIVSTIGLLSRTKFPFSVNADLGNGISWMLAAADEKSLVGPEIERGIRSISETIQNKSVA